MAQALLEKIAKEKGLEINIKSAGVFALDGEKASKGAIEAMKEEGIDLKNHRANIIYRDLLEEADLILTMGLSHKNLLISKFDFIQGKVYTLKEYAYGKEEDIEDPYGGDIHAYNKAKKEIKEALKEMVEQLAVDN